MKNSVKEIEKLKKEKDAIILAHNYQRKEVQEIADFLGDSLELAKKAATLSSKIIVFAGVSFMAETAKILNPDKKVLLPEKEAYCEMAEMVDIGKLKELKKKYPDAAVVSYINTTAETKTLTDIVCTSANAVKIVESLPQKRIIFIPDKNLGTYVKKRSSKEIILYEGFCYVHHKLIMKKDIEKIRKEYPDAHLMVHPETPEEIQEMADSILSTGQMLKEASKIPEKTIIVGTEIGMVDRLKRDIPDKEFIPLTMRARCRGMKEITLESILNSLKYERYEIFLDKETMEKARVPIERMLKVK